MADKIREEIEATNGTAGRILIEEHQDGAWIEMGREEYAVLNDNQIDLMIQALVQIKKERLANR